MGHKITSQYLQNARYSKHCGRKNSVQKNLADYRWDTGLRGFGVRIYPSGNISYCISYTTRSGTRKRYVFAEYPKIPLAEARALAQSYFIEIAQGNDPQQAKQDLRQEKTFLEYIYFYVPMISCMSHSMTNIIRWGDVYKTQFF